MPNTITLKKLTSFLPAVLILIGLYLTSHYSYLLFHSTAEVIVIAVGLAIFMLAWNARDIINNNYLLLVAISLLFTSILDIVHLLAFKGMPVFQHDFDANLPTQLWIVMRYITALTLLAAPFMLGKKVNWKLTWLFYSSAVLLVALSIFSWRNFPAAYIEGVGLTQFKIVSEYIICAIILAASYFLYKKKSYFDPGVLRTLLVSALFSLIAELFFTSYVGVYDFSNMTGHLFIVASSLLLYNALVSTSIRKPFALLFRELKQSEEELRESKRQKEEFLYQTIHDIKSPLTTIGLTLETFGCPCLADEPMVTRNLDMIRKAKDQMTNLVDDLFKIAKGEQTDFTFDIEEVRLNEIVAETLIQFEEAFKKKNMVIVYEPQNDLPAIKSDRERVTEVVTNLLENAIKYGKEGGLLHISHDPGEAKLATTVKSTGVGVSTENLERIFEPYFRERNDNRVRGTGLGLYIVKKFIEKMGGEIGAESEPGEWTSITFRLPRA